MIVRMNRARTLHKRCANIAHFVHHPAPPEGALVQRPADQLNETELRVTNSAINPIISIARVK
ncbi:hypothetical protein SAMN05444276_102582 [Paracoccus sanguinis]|uniref:Uncharacterized protein n=1 Tax=Paracoccus sanguinis TaxID=1545044 RepID=A0A1H2XPD3_9RHOB|nr:hypothetical protein SAMN05444276_102582 [Paracoccus sanguinis]